VTPVTGLPEVVRDLDPALILAGADAAALATGMIAALSDPNALPDADACRAYAQRFDWRTIAGRIRDVYASVA
jgi:glycosyltransferase involved in cell wall biosynthesis